MSENSSEKHVTRRNWYSFASVLTVQSQNAFNDNLVKFVIIGLALAVAQGSAIGDNIQYIMSALLPLPFILLAPLAGYFSDRYSKRSVIYACLVAQMLLFMGLAAAVYYHNIPLAILGFFLLSVQSTFFSPAKQGILKELVGSPRLAFVNGLMQMCTMLGILGGMWLGGKWFDSILLKGGDPWNAAFIPIGVIGLFAMTPLVIGLFVEHTPPHQTAPFTPSVFVRHFVHLKQLFENHTLRRTAIGISFYWFVAYFLGLIVVSFGIELHPDTSAGGATSASAGMTATIGIGLMFGSSAVSAFSRRRIELGMVPLGGFGLAIGLLGLGLSPVGGNLFYFSLIFIGFSSGFFLVPLVAHLQNEAEEKHRGRILSANGLLTSISGFLAIGLGLGLKELGLSSSTQVLLFAPLMLFGSLYVLKLQPQEFVRFTVGNLVKFIYKIDTAHLERIPKTGGLLMIANHVSYIDWLILSVSCPRPIRFIFNERYEKMPVSGWFLRLFSSLPVTPSRTREVMRKTSDAIRNGDIVCIFPEGQLSRTGIMNEMKRGFTLIAKMAESPIQPVYLDSMWGSIFSFERNRYFKKWPLHLRYSLTVNFGDPIPYENATPEVARESLLQLSRESLDARDELQSPLDVALVRSLKQKPGRACFIEHSKQRHQLKRGQILALSIALSRRWKTSLPDDSDKVAVFLPAGSTPLYINLGLIMAGKIPVNFPFNHQADLDLMSDRLDELGIHTIITSRAFFPHLENMSRSKNPEYHLLDMRSEINAAGIVRIMMERLLVRFEPTRFALRRLGLEKTADSCKDHHDLAYGFVPDPTTSSAKALPPTVFLSHHNILTNVHQLRSVNLLNPRETFFAEAPINTPAGIQFSLFLPIFAHTTAVMRSFGQQSASDNIETMIREDSITTVLLSPALSRQMLDEDAWHPERREQVRQLLTFQHTEEELAGKLTNHTGSPVLRAYSLDSPGVIIAVSMLDPLRASAASLEQNGNIPNSVGRLLPGIAVKSDEGLEIMSPSLSEKWHPLPEGARMDEEGFVFLDSQD